jgi:hypothetical protein
MYVNPKIIPIETTLKISGGGVKNETGEPSAFKYYIFDT